MVMLGHEGWAFVHVPRTGGTAIRQALQYHGGRCGLRKHEPCAAVRQLYPNRIIFGFVRNPWARLVSLYAHLRQDEAARQIYAGRCFTSWRPGFKEWLFGDDLVTGSNLGSWGAVPPPRQPQSWWLEGCDYVGLYEKLFADLERICRRIGIRRRLDLDLHNHSRHKHHRDLYDDESRDAVAAWHADDIERWGYRF